MDIHDILDQKIKRLPAGDYLDGLRAVKSHIDAAVRHLTRGQQEPDESLFTDVIFRCNQAFEGSIKEAYRVLAAKDPQRKTPAEIEDFLASANILRKKVLDQFTTYRKEWRNPSTHDYTLDFNEDEALLAVVSVTAFAIVLCDQIDSKLAFDAAAANAAHLASDAEKEGPLLDLVASKILSFAAEYAEIAGTDRRSSVDYYRLEGALAGYLSAETANVSDLTVVQNRGYGQEPDVTIRRRSEEVVVELKRGGMTKSGVASITRQAVRQVSRYLHENNVVGAVAFVYSSGEERYEVRQASEPFSDRVRIVAPAIKSSPTM